MTEQLIETQEPSAPDTSHSSRTSRSAAGWVDCATAVSVKELYREGYTPRSLSWISPKPLWEARNDRIVRVLGDPTNNERTRWVAAMRAKGDIDPDLIVRRYADAKELSVHGPRRSRRGRRLAIPRPATALRHRRRDGIHLHRQRRHLSGRRRQRVRGQVLLALPQTSRARSTPSPGTTTGTTGCTAS